MSVSIIAGLGNPGPFYKNTRHNIGFFAVDALAKYLSVPWRKVSRFKAKVAQCSYRDKTLFLLKPLTYMNQSGFSLSALSRFYKFSAESILVICDDINIAPGGLKLKHGGTHGGHNGITSIIQLVGSEFFRFKIGIGHKSNQKMDLKDHVLGQWSSNERKIFTDKVPFFVESLLYIIDHGPIEAMNLVNQKKNFT